MRRHVIRIVLACVPAFVIGVSVSATSREQAAAQHAALETMRDAVNKGDAPRYASVYSDAAEIHIFGTTVLRGRSAIEKHEVDLLAQFPNARFEFYEIWSQGRRAVAHYGVNAQTASKQSMGHEGLLFFTFNAAGEIERENRYLDSLTPMAQLGALGAAARRPVPVLPPGPRVTDMIIMGGDPEMPPRDLWVPVAELRRADIVARLSSDRSVDELMLADSFDGLLGPQRWLDAISAFDDTTFDATTVIGTGYHLLIEGILHARVVKPFGPIKPSPARVAVHRAMIIELDAKQRISGIKAFMNGKELAESIGQWPIR